jgi:hypothetical protein
LHEESGLDCRDALDDGKQWPAIFATPPPTNCALHALQREELTGSNFLVKGAAEAEVNFTSTVEELAGFRSLAYPF